MRRHQGFVKLASAAGLGALLPASVGEPTLGVSIIFMAARRFWHALLLILSLGHGPVLTACIVVSATCWRIQS